MSPSEPLIGFVGTRTLIIGDVIRDALELLLEFFFIVFSTIDNLSLR
jgi:hypothetical protein